MREKFLKGAGGEDGERKKEKKDRKDREKAERRKIREEEEELEPEGDAWQTQGKAFQPKPKMFAKDADINTSVVLKKLSEILAARGKKGRFLSSFDKVLKYLGCSTYFLPFFFN